MSLAYANTPELSCFAPATAQFERMLQQLTGDELMAAQHGETEAYIHQQGIELQRLLLQGYLQILEQQEQPLTAPPFPGEAEQQRIRCGTQRTLCTLFGNVTVSRRSYCAAEHSSVFPIDTQLNLPKSRYSEGLKWSLAAQAVHCSFDVAQQNLSQIHGGHAPKRQSLELIQDAAQDFEAFYQQSQVRECAQDDVLVLTFDGKGIVMRPDGLREGTRRKAQAAKNKLQTRLSAGEKRDRKRMAMVAAVYDQPARVRAAEDVICTYPDQVSHRSPPARLQNKRVWASVEREPAAVIEEAFTEALKRDPARQRRWVILIDGQPHQLHLIHKAINRLQIEATIIMDFIHVLEYLWKAARCRFDKVDPAAERWVAERALKLLTGNIGQVIKGLRLNLKTLAKEKRKTISQCIRYLSHNRRRLRYAEALSAGLPIATGVIEGACRHLINDRLDITGARWSLAGAEAMLKLRSIYASGDWEAYRQYHRQQCHQRNYGHLDGLLEAA